MTNELFSLSSAEVDPALEWKKFAVKEYAVGNARVHCFSVTRPLDGVASKTDETVMIFKVSRRDNLDRHYLLKIFGFGIFAHRIHHDELPGTFHSHPWDGFSIVFGSYTEEFLDGSLHVRRGFNIIKAPRFHRVMISRPVWTLFFHGRRYNRWKVCDREGNLISEEPWRGIGGRTSYRPAS